MSYDKLKQVLLERSIQLAGNSNSKYKMMGAATSSTSINSNSILNTAAATTVRSSESVSATGLSPTAGLNSTSTIIIFINYVLICTQQLNFMLLTFVGTVREFLKRKIVLGVLFILPP